MVPDDQLTVLSENRADFRHRFFLAQRGFSRACGLLLGVVC